MFKKFAHMSIVLVSAIAMSTVVMAAGPPQTPLRGDYALVGTRTCVQNYTAGFHFEGEKLALQPYNNADGYAGTTRSAHYQGILHLNGDGTGTLNEKVLQINNTMMKAGNAPVSGWTNRCEVTLQENGFGTLVLSYPTGCVTTITSGSGVGTIWGSNVFSPLSVVVSANGDTLLLSDVEPDEEDSWSCADPDCNTKYTWYRICARTFTAARLSTKGNFPGNPGSPPSVTTLPATSVGATFATLNGNVTPNGLATNAWFEFSTDPAHSSFTSTPVKSVGFGTATVIISQPLVGLVPGTTYYFRVAANNSLGTARGAILSFTPQP